MSALYSINYYQVLGPNDLRLAADAFEAALQSLDESACEVAPHAARRRCEIQLSKFAQPAPQMRRRCPDQSLSYEQGIRGGPRRILLTPPAPMIRATRPPDRAGGCGSRRALAARRSEDDRGD